MHARMAENSASAQFTDSEPEDEPADDANDEESKDANFEQNKEDYEKKRRKRTKEDIEREAVEKGDLYAILNLQDKTYEAGENDIRRAYQKLALKYHPDKLGENYNDEAKAHWLKIQDAYEHLSDPVKKKKYDSTLPFNDSIPKQEDISDETFYDLFDEVFKRNARFAKKKPVPNIGTPETPLAEVNKFYKYWDNFDTWREFSQYDEYDVSEASDRYERRYME